VSPTTVRAVLAGLLTLPAIVTSIMLAPAPAAAHPFGPPLTAQFTADGSDVHVRWSAADDDWVALGRVTGGFDEPTPTDGDGPVAAQGPITGLERLQRSPAVAAYLVAGIAISQDGRSCRGAVTDVTDLLERGAGLSYECPRDVDEVEVELTLLTEVHEAYRTVGTAGQERHLHTREEPAQTYDLAAVRTEEGGPVAAWTLALGGLIAASVIAVGARGFRRPTADATTLDGDREVSSWS
jgi:hypothetical protein